jgi:NAD(P)-dependent dehydrogenase (short-subunit alcohol dehydrogenase family)
MQPDPALKWIVVTGASAGIGKALVERLAREGRNVIAAARDPTRANVPNGPGRVEVVRLDFDDPVGVETAARDITGIARAAGLAALVNMAGIIIEGPLEAIPTPALRRQFEVNVIGPVALTQALLPLLAKTRGTVVNIGAVSAHLTPPFYGPIAASKAALASFNDAMRQEFAPLGVKVFLIEPGAMKTDIFAASRATRDTWLTRRPDVEHRYRPALAAGARLREVRRRRSRGRCQGGHGGAFGSPGQAQSCGRQGRGRVRDDVAAPHSPARSVGKVGARAERGA